MRLWRRSETGGPPACQTSALCERKELMKLVQVLGPGCAKCTRLAENAQSAVNELGIEATVEKVSDINVITGFGVMMTPALVIDGEVKVVGKVATPDEIKQLLS